MTSSSIDRFDSAKPSAAQDMELAHQTCVLMHDAEIGIAVFGRKHELLASNPAYRALRGYKDERAEIGQTLEQLARRSLLRDGYSDAQIEKIVSCDVERLEASRSDQFNTVSNGGQAIRIARHYNNAGLLVETLSPQRRPQNSAVKEEIQAVKGGRVRLQSVLESMSDGFAVFNPDGVLVSLNQRYVELQPHIADALTIGNSHEEIIRAAYRSGQVNHGGVTEEAFLAFAKGHLDKPNGQTVDQLKDGRWIRFIGNKLSDGSTVFIQSDVTELKQQREENAEINRAIDEQAVQMEMALNSMFAGFIMFDEDQRVVFCNDLYHEMFKFPEGFVVPGVLRQELMDKAIEIGLFKAGYDRQAQEVVDVSTSGKAPSVHQYHFNDGRILQTRHRHLPSGGSFVMFLDITNEENLKKSMERNNHKLMRSNEELQNFAYVASHDLQEPLRKIEAFGDRLLKKYQDQLPDDGQMYMDRIQNAAVRMRQLINDLLSFSRVTSKGHNLEEVDLSELMDEVQSDLQVTLEEKRAELIFEDLPTIEVDALQMRQLFQNLISNALKFTKSDVDPRVSITASVVKGLKPNTDAVELRISDNGIGFDNKYKDQIFAIFQRLHGRMEYEGTGIGLATCRKIVEGHYGSIDADGVEGEGATFIITLPVKQPKRAE